MGLRDNYFGVQITVKWICDIKRRENDTDIVVKEKMVSGAYLKV